MAPATAVDASFLTDEMVSTYRRQGFLKLPRLFDDASLATLTAICRGTEGEPLSGLSGQADGDTGKFAYQNDERYRRMWTNSFDLRLRFPEMMDAVVALAGVARRLLGEDVRVFWDKTFVKPPREEGSRGSVWHQDFPYNPIDRRGMLTVWVALEDVPAESGALRFVPGSHRLGPLGRLNLVANDWTIGDLLNADDLAAVGEPVTVPLSPGEATVHDALTLHGSAPNDTAVPRRAWTSVFLPASTQYTGGPHPQAGIDALGMTPFSHFDHPQFQVPGRVERGK